MAGDWIKLEHATPRKPEVFQIAGELGIEADAAVGLLIKFWVWVSENMSEKCPKVFGHLSMIDAIVGRTGFGQAAVNAGWLAIDGNQLWIPNYNEHLSESAKKRAEDAKRKRLQRKMSEVCPENVRDLSETAGTKTGPEKRREEITNTDVFVIGEKPKRTRKRFEPPTVEQVADYCRERNNGIDAERFVAFYAARGWMAGKNKMTDWQAAVRTWEKNNDGATGRPVAATASQNREAERLTRNFGALATFMQREAASAGQVRLPGVRESDGRVVSVEANGGHDGPATRSVVQGAEGVPSTDHQRSNNRTLFD